ncbi:1-aminocyclopropane-1-carboxylate oxidase 5 [Bienertia sinuspersici]
MVVPVIDFSKLNGEERDATMAEIHNGCEEWGFFQLVNHGISDELLERVKKISSECYKQERAENFKTSKPMTMLNELVEKKKGEKLEGVDWEDVFLLTDDNDWQSKLPGFKETMAEYRAEVKKLAGKLMEIMDENLGLPKGYIKKAFNCGEENNNETAFFGTKVSHYPPCPRPELVTGLRAHTDAGGVILLFQDEKFAGLQMLKGEEWLEVQPVPNAIVINTGDQIEVLSNGRYKSAWHRVLASSTGNRRSIASFYNPSFKAAIAPAPQLVNKEENCPVEGVDYPRFLFGDYMSVYAEQKFLPKDPRFQAVKSL